jgi:transcriptional regulator with XRE-family HTH domain
VFVNYKVNQEFCVALGTQVRGIRQKQGLSMRQLALQAEMEYSQLSKIERGVINTTVSTLQSLAEAMNIPVKDFFDFKFTTKG